VAFRALQGPEAVAAKAAMMTSARAPAGSFRMERFSAVGKEEVRVSLLCSRINKLSVSIIERIQTPV
jgi:hypothetical protein